MTVGRTSGWMDPSWFKYVDIPGIDSGKMKYGVLKDECRDQFREAVQARREEQKLAFEKFKEDARRQGKFVRLTKAQLEHLSASYDPREMTREDYQAFIDDLIEYGVLDEADKDYISYSGLDTAAWCPLTSPSPHAPSPPRPISRTSGISGPAEAISWTGPGISPPTSISIRIPTALNRLGAPSCLTGFSRCC